MISGRLYDGKSAAEKNVVVRMARDLLWISFVDSGSDITVRASEIEVQETGELAILTWENATLELEHASFLSLNFPARGRESKFILKLLGASAALVVLFMAFHRPIISTLADLVPDDVVDHQAKFLVQNFEPLHCKKADGLLEELFSRLGENRQDYRVFLIKSPEVNAYAMPGKIILLTDGLLKDLESPEALAGILAHELAHVQMGHLKRKFVSTMLVQGFSRNNGSYLLEFFASSFLSQTDEKEADEIAALSLENQQISPVGMVSFFKRLEEKEAGFMKYVMWSHPAYPERIKVFSKTYDTGPVLSPEGWASLKSACD